MRTTLFTLSLLSLSFVNAAPQGVGGIISGLAPVAEDLSNSVEKLQPVVASLDPVLKDTGAALAQRDEPPSLTQILGQIISGLAPSADGLGGTVKNDLAPTLEKLAPFLKDLGVDVNELLGQL